VKIRETMPLNRAMLKDNSWVWVVREPSKDDMLSARRLVERWTVATWMGARREPGSTTPRYARLTEKAALRDARRLVTLERARRRIYGVVLP